MDMTNVLFFDDFEQGPEVDWQVVQGQPIYSNGTVTGGERVMAVTGNKDWENLVIENETWGGPCDPYYSNSLIIKFIDLRNYLGVSYQSCSAHFVVIKDGDAQHIPNGINISHSDGSKFKIIITAKDGYFTASVGPQTFDYYDDKFMTGMVGYYVDPGCFLDSFKVSELP